MPILNSINQMLNEMKSWRQDLHKIPEIGLEEYKTSKFIKDKLNQFNISYKEGYSNTGLVAWIKGEKGNSNFPEGGNSVPRSSVIAIRKKDGSEITFIS